MISQLLRLIELDNIRGVPDLQIEEETTVPEAPTGPTTEAPKEETGGARRGGIGFPPGVSIPLGRGIRGVTQTGLQESLTSFRPAGEIRAGTGKPRRNVWNEASLRLKDALGL